MANIFRGFEEATKVSLMVLKAKGHRQSYERRYFWYKNTKKDRDNVVRVKIKRILVELMVLEDNKQKVSND